MARREFTKAVKVEIIKRATRVSLNYRMPHCEKCEAQCANSRFEIDHRDPDAMQIDKSKPLTVDEGWLLCRPCHAEKTAKDVGDIAKAKRREAAHVGARRPKQAIPSAPGSMRGPARKHEARVSLPPRALYR